MNTEAVCEELEIGKSTLKRYIERGVICKPKIEKGRRGKSHTWTDDQVADAKEKMKNIVHYVPKPRKDHKASSDSAGLINKMFGVRL